MIYDGLHSISSEALVRLGYFAAIFFAVALSESMAPRRRLSQSKSRRWIGNLGMQVIDTILLAIIPVFPIGVAVVCAREGWGLLHYFSPEPLAAGIIGFLALDFIIYLQHRLFHRVPLFWRIHMVHHTDRDIDVTTALRFHPLEIAASLTIKILAVAALGVLPLSVLIFEIVLNGAAMFNHGNINIPSPLDRILRLVLITPDMHRVHHSVIPRETNSNFGFSVPWWDRLWGSYRAQPQDGHNQMKIGLNGYQDDRSLKLSSLLLMPFYYPKRITPDAQ